jgi:hypothetical protein
MGRRNPGLAVIGPPQMACSNPMENESPMKAVSTLKISISPIYPYFRVILNIPGCYKIITGWRPETIRQRL